LLCGIAATATAAAPPPAIAIHSHFFDPPPPPPVDVTWPAAAGVSPLRVKFTLSVVGFPEATVTSRAFSR
jgi:hypothetical protein